MKPLVSPGVHLGTSGETSQAARLLRPGYRERELVGMWALKAAPRACGAGGHRHGREGLPEGLRGLFHLRYFRHPFLGFMDGVCEWVPG